MLQQLSLINMEQVDEDQLSILMEQQIKDVEYLVGELATTYEKLAAQIVDKRKQIINTKNTQALIPLNALINRLLVASSSNLHEINHTWQVLIEWSMPLVEEVKINDSPV